MRSPAELRAQREVTRAFVDANYELITLIPRVETRTATGGREWTEGTPRTPQRFHIIERNTNARTDTRVPGGEQDEEEYTLLGYWDAQVAVGDTFTLDGRTWRVQPMDFENGYERRAAVIRFGR